MALGNGIRLGPYEILGPIGSGGMGEVYRARDTRLDRTVAVKVLSARLDSAAARERFEREARAVSSLNHPQICVLHDIGSKDGIDYLVMEYLVGETLSARLSRGPLPLEQAFRYAIQIADALALAHRQDVVHRDLKPGNIMLTKDGAKLLDFGLAKLGAGSKPLLAADETLTKALTAQGSILGTLQYMAPEQLEGKEADARTDIFAFGAVLFEMLTGRKAFEGKSQASLIAAIMSSDATPISPLKPPVPPAVELVVRSCLAKDPDQRWQNAHDVLLHLQTIAATELQGRIPVALQSRRNVRERIWQALALLGMAAAVWSGINLFRPSPHKNLPMRFAIPITADFSFGPTDFPVLSPDGQRLCFCATTRDHKQVLWVHALDSSTTQALAGTENCRAPFWSADASAIAFFSEGDLKKLDVASGGVQTICHTTGGNDATRGNSGSWNAENVIVFSEFGQPIQRVPASGGIPTPVLALDTSGQETGQQRPIFLPQGRAFLYSSATKGLGPSSVMVASLDGRQRHVLLRGGVRPVAALPGFLLYLRGPTLLAQALDANRLQLRGDAFSLPERVSSGRGVVLASFSDNGTLAYRPAYSSLNELVVYDRDGRRSGILGQPRDYTGMKLSPDNKQLVVNVVSGSMSNLWLLELGNGVLSRLTSSGGEDAVWSPDGKHIVFASRRGGRTDLYRKTIGAGEEEVFFASPEHKYAEEWLSDGTLLYITTDGKRFARIPVSGERKSSILLETQFRRDGPRVSPDGHWITYASDESGEWQIHVASYPAFEQRRQVSHNGGVQARWNREGRELFYLDLDGKMMAVAVNVDQNGITTGVPRALFKTRVQVSPTEDQYAVMNDGRRFIVIEPTGEATPRIHITLNWAARLPK